MASSQANIFLQPDERRDFSLVIEGKRVYVDRENLTAWSPVFQAIFFPEDSEQPKSGMQMKGKKLQDFLHFLHYICPTTPYSKKITESNVLALLAYADEYSVAVMRDHCVAYLTEQLDKETTANDTLVEYLRLASLYRLVDLQKQLIPLVAQLFLHQITAAHAVLSAPVLAAIYQARALLLERSGADHDAGCTGELPNDLFMCRECHKLCAISGGKSACCSAVACVPTSLSAKALQQCAFVCRVCDEPFQLPRTTNKNHHRSTCCKTYFWVYPKCEPCNRRAVGAAPAAKRRCVDFSVDLLQK